MEDKHGPSRDELEELAAAVDEWCTGLTILSSTLREMEATMMPVDFETWAMVTAGLDRETLRDFLDFDGDAAQITDRMMAAMQRVVSALS